MKFLAQSLAYTKDLLAMSYYYFQLWSLKIIFLCFIYLSNLYAPCGARTDDPEIKSCMLYLLSQSGAPKVIIIVWANELMSEL